MKPCIITTLPWPFSRLAMYSMAMRADSSSREPTKAVGTRSGFGIDVDDRNAGGQGLVHRGRTGLDLARVEDDGVHLLRDEALHLLHLALGAALGVVDDQLDAQFAGLRLHRLVEHHDELAGEVQQRDADDDRFAASRGLVVPIAAAQRG